MRELSLVLLKSNQLGFNLEGRLLAQQLANGEVEFRLSLKDCPRLASLEMDLSQMIAFIGERHLTYPHDDLWRFFQVKFYEFFQGWVILGSFVVDIDK